MATTPETGAPVTTTPEGDPRGSLRVGRRSGPWSSITTRIVVSSIVVLSAATVASILLVRQVLLVQADDRIDAALVQESRELNRLASGSDPETGEPFGDVARVFEVFLQRNVPARNEAFLTFLDGEPYLRSRTVLPYRLEEDEALVGRWSRITRSEAGSVQTPGGTVRYLAVPVRGSGGTRGLFVAAIFRDLEADEVEPAVRAAALVGIASLLIGSLLAARVARRIIAPVREVEATARSISESDLSRRIEIRGDDEITHLAETFNDLLARLERAFLAQRAFVDEAGHELRTPITIIRGQLELLSDEPERRGNALALVTGELDRMGRMVNDLLLLAKSEHPGFLELDLVDAGPLTREVFEKALTLGDRRWGLEQVAEAGLVGDRQRLTQALIQLLQNAADHTDAEDEISLGSGAEGGRVRFWVRDSGPGIPPEMRERVFDRFARAGSRRSDGAGLGLAIVRAIAEGHGGRVWVESEIGRGTTFTIEVPVDHDLSEDEGS